MKIKFTKLTKAMLFCFVISLSSCEKDLYENLTNTNTESLAFSTKIVALKDIPDVELFINNKVGDIAYKSKTGKSTSSLSKITFDINKIIEVTDTIKNKNYSIRFVFDDTPENVFFNLIINVLSTGEKVPFVEKYTCAISNFTTYKNSQYNFNNFQGTVELFKANVFFGKTAILGKKSGDDPCLPKFYPNGDPIPQVSSFVYAGGSTSGSGGTLSTGTTTTTTTTTTTGSYPNIATGGQGIFVTGTSSSGTSTSGGSTGCCSCGNCGTHWYMPTRQKDHVQMKTAADLCPDIVPIGYIGVSAEPEKLQMLRAELQISSQQWQWLHGKDELMDLIQKYINSNPTNINQSKEVALWAIDYMMNNSKPFFATFTIDYMQNNPTVTWKQFQNWFMGTSEGQDGDYDAAYWEDPNLSFPKQDLPTYDNYYNGMPRFSDGSFMIGADNVYGLVGGAVLQARVDFPKRTENTCALKVSIALNRSGVLIPNLLEKTVEGAGEFKGMYFFLNARSLNSWMRETFGTNTSTSNTPTNANHLTFTAIDGGINGVNFPNKLKDLNGIYSMITTENYNIIEKGASGHADLIFNGSAGKGTCIYGCNFNLPIERIDVWILK